MRKETTDAMTAWGTVVVAFGVVFAAIQVVLVGRQLQDAAEQTAKYYEQSRRQTAYQALAEWSRSQPPNAIKCIDVMANFDQTTFNSVVDRLETSIGSNLGNEILACFADQSPAEVKELFDGGKLTRKGSSLLWGRVLTALNTDENVTRLVKYGIGDTQMIDEGIKNSVRFADAQVIRLFDVKARRETFAPLQEYIAKSIRELIRSRRSNDWLALERRAG